MKLFFFLLDLSYSKDDSRLLFYSNDDSKLLFYFKDDSKLWLSSIYVRAPLYMSSGLSLLSLLIIAVDRFIAVVYAVRYRQIVTQRRAWIAVAIIWLYELLTLGIPSVYYGYYNTEEILRFVRGVFILLSYRQC